jgi:hypothetical protein
MPRYLPGMGWGQGVEKETLGDAVLGGRPGGLTLLSGHPVLLPVTNCTTIEGAEYSSCGPPCPRSCDDLVVSPLT